MNVDFGWKGEASGLEHSGPEKGMKIGDVFSNEMVDFTSVVVPPIVKGFTMVVAPLSSRCDISNRCVEPDIPIVFAVRFGNFEFGRLPILVAPRGFYNIAGSTDSVLGYEALEPFIMRIDYKRKRIWLKRETEATSATRGDDDTTPETLPASSAGDS